MSADLLATGGALWAGPGEYWDSGAVEIRDGTVTYAGPAEGRRPQGPAPRETLDASGGLMLPGLINAHCHGAMTLFRGLADDLPLEVWLHQHMFPAEARFVNEEMVELCTLLAAGEMLLSGTTCVGDAYFCMQGAARAYERAGLRAAAAQGVVDFPAPGAPDPARNLEAVREFIQEWKDRCPRIAPAVFAHSVYTCSSETLAGCAELAAEFGVGWYTHLAESRGEVEQVRERYGASPARRLERLGLLESLTAAVHGVWLEPEEWELLAERETALVHCPESNAKLASGQADAAAWLKAGLTVGLGSDGAASNNDLDMIGEMGFAARAAKLRDLDPGALPAGAVLDMALAGSAACLGLAGKAGRLRPGYAGDLIVLQTDAPHLTPLYDVPSHLVYAARGGDVRHVVVDGRVLVRDRRVLSFDLDEVMARVRELAARVRSA